MTEDYFQHQPPHVCPHTCIHTWKQKKTVSIHPCPSLPVMFTASLLHNATMSRYKRDHNGHRLRDVLSHSHQPEIASPIFKKKSKNSVRNKKKGFLNASVIRRSIQSEEQGEEEASIEAWAIGCWHPVLQPSEA